METIVNKMVISALDMNNNDPSFRLQDAGYPDHLQMDMTCHISLSSVGAHTIVLSHPDVRSAFDSLDHKSGEEYFLLWPSAPRKYGDLPPWIWVFWDPKSVVAFGHKDLSSKFSDWLFKALILELRCIGTFASSTIMINKHLIG